jgi:hypothetical protein
MYGIWFFYHPIISNHQPPFNSDSPNQKAFTSYVWNEVEADNSKHVPDLYFISGEQEHQLRLMQNE